MSKQSSNNKSGGIGLLGLLGIVFITLKLTGYIDWSWWWVTAPFWGIPAIGAAIWLICTILLGIVEVFEKASKKKG